MKRNILFLLMLALSSQAFTYDIVERTTLIEDRLKLQESLRPLGHDFYFDANGFFSTDIMDLIDDVQTASESVIDGNQQSAIDAAASLTNVWSGKELSGRLNLGVGVPLFQFNAWGIKFVPELLRVDFGLTANVAISEETLEPGDFIDMLGSDIDPIVKALIESLSVDEIVASIDDGDDNNNNLFKVLSDEAARSGDNVFVTAVNQNEETLEDIIIPQEIVDALTGTDTVPNLDIYLKADTKIGPKLAWFGENFFGHVNLYGLLRVDSLMKITSASINGGGDSFDTPTDIEETNLTIDAAVGYRADNFSIMASMDEVKLANLSEADNANNLYETPILFKLYGEMRFKPFDFMKLKAFGGIHKRAGYGIGDGYFIGADLGAYVWKDRLGIQFRTQLDAEHITLAPQFKFWVMQLEGMYKLPISDDVDGRKTGSILGVNFRVFI